MVSPWITGALGWAFFGPLGGLFGYAAGSLFNAAQRANLSAPPGGKPRRRRATISSRACWR